MTLATPLMHLSDEDKLLIDWCPIEETPKIQEFIDAHWQRDHVLARDAELLQWQHRMPNEGGQLSVLTAHEAGRLLGILGIIQFEFCLRGQRLSGAWLTTWVSAPEARPKGVGLGLLKRVLDGSYAFVGTLGVSPSALKIYGSLGFTAWESIPRWIRVMTPAALEHMLPEDALPFDPQKWADFARGNGTALGSDESHLLQDTERPQCHVFQVAYGCGHQVEGRHQASTQANLVIVGSPPVALPATVKPTDERNPSMSNGAVPRDRLP